MPLGLISEEEFNKELESLGKKPLAPQSKIIEIKHGRGEGTKNVPEETRAEIGCEAISGANALQLSEDYGVSLSSVSAYKNGSTSTASYNKPNQKIVSEQDNVRNRVTNIAQEKLMSALGAITFGDVPIKPNIASAIAKDMSSIIKNMEPEDKGGKTNNTVIIFKPRMKEEDDYEIIDVQE